MKTVYVETSIVSYLTALPARDILAAAWQNATSRLWETQRARFELVTSQLVLDEASEGHPEAAQRRLGVLQTIAHLPIPDPVTDLATALLAERRQRMMPCTSPCPHTMGLITSSLGTVDTLTMPR